MTLSRIVAIVVTACVLGGCLKSHSTSPYAGNSEEMRLPQEALTLNEQAVDVIDRDGVKAESLLRQALAKDLYCAPAHNNLGTLLLRQGKLYEAAGEFEWAKKLLPGHPDPRMNLALTLERAGRTEDAISTYKTALEVYPEHIQTMQALARIQVRSGKVDAETPHLLGEVSIRGDTTQWREWARLEMAKAEK